MQVPFQPAQWIDNKIREVAANIESFDEAFDPMVRPADPRFGDYQANGVLPMAKRLKTNPRALAVELDKALKSEKVFPENYFSWEIAGPGFLNFKVSPSFYQDWLKRFHDPETLREGAERQLEGKKFVVDFSAPNTAKEMHVGHIRSTVIGEAICRLLEYCGAETVRDNHIGDWGTQFGMIIHSIKKTGYDLENPSENALAELEQLYKQGHAAYKSGDAEADAIRQELVKLQNGDEENLQIWNRITEISWNAFEEIYNELDVHFDEVLGESFYRDKVQRIYSELEEAGISELSEGAQVVFHPEHPRFKKQPFIVRKGDGASNYATTDLATVLHRTETFKPDEIIYVVDFRQSDHFEQLFLTVEKWFEKAGRKIPEMKHVSFGTILNEDGKPIKTKEGGSVKLRALLDEAKERSYQLVTEKNPDLDEAERKQIAEAVGLGSVRYADLSQNRTSDYIFSWERMLSLEGNTAPYLLYAVARIHSIFRKAKTSPGAFTEKASTIETEEELQLARSLLGFPEALEQSLSDYRPHYLSNYLYQLAGDFSTFYNANKVIVDEEAIKARRLMLCSRTLLTLETGLHLLGLKTLERM